MIRLVADENLNEDLVRGLILRQPAIDIVRARDERLAGLDDPALLAWAAEFDRIIVTHDRATMPRFAWDRLQTGEVMTGLIVVPDRLPVGLVVEDLLLMNNCREQAEWIGRVIYLPL